ncbi:MAG: hypothetical protein ACJAZO_000763 [Myxococcota bacterium]|jgi:hypothetical protein
MESEDLYAIVYDAVRQAVADSNTDPETHLLRRFEEGSVAFTDNTGKVVKQMPTGTLFKKVTSIREKLRVLEQKLNNHGSLSQSDKAEMQVYVSRCYGSLTSFNFLFAEDADKFKS